MTGSDGVASERHRVVQISDTHLSAAGGRPSQWDTLRSWLDADPPDLLVHTGDIVLENPDDEGDRSAARRLLDEFDVAQVFIPGNHDIGFYDEPLRLADRLDTFRSAWGDDRFLWRLGAWRLVGVDAYLLGHDSALGHEHDAWFAATVRADGFTMVFVHQPPVADRRDGWEMPAHAAAAFAAAIAGRDIAVIASGHRHCAALRTIGAQRMVWAPSLTIRGGDTAEWLRQQDAEDVRPAPGAVEYVLGADGEIEVRFVPL